MSRTVLNAVFDSKRDFRWSLRAYRVAGPSFRQGWDALRRRKVFLLLVVLATTIVGFPYLGFNNAKASIERWAWFYAGSVVNEWSVGRGRADVEISSEAVDARLYEDGELAITLKGTIRKGKVDATATFHRTDAPAVRLTGTFGRVRWKRGGTREAILLTEPGAPWGGAIGLTREIETK
jgi:hypothetical protein